VEWGWDVVADGCGYELYAGRVEFVLYVLDLGGRGVYVCVLLGLVDRAAV
jgi:hypothetical protein